MTEKAEASATPTAHEPRKDGQVARVWAFLLRLATVGQRRTGCVTLMVPAETFLEACRAHVATRMARIAGIKPSWWRTPCSHNRRRRRHLLSVKEANGKPGVRLTHRGTHLTVRPGSSHEQRERVVHVAAGTTSRTSGPFATPATHARATG